MAFTTAYIIFLSAIALSLGIYTLYIIFYKKDEEPRDATIVRNDYMSQYTKGHAEAIVKRFIKGTSRVGLVLIPKDIDYLQNYEGGSYKDVKEEEMILWYPKEKLHFKPKGTASDHRHILEIEPLSPDDINEGMKNTKYGKLMMSEISDNNFNMTDKAFVQRELEKTQKIISGDYVGELKTEMLESIDELAENRVKIAIRDKDKKVEPFKPVTSSSNTL